MSSNRRQYRVDQRRRFVSVNLRTPEGLEVEGIAASLSSGGASLTFDSNELPALEPDCRLELVFHALLLTRPIEASAHLRYYTEIEDGTVQLGVEFANSDEVLRQVPYVMLREFNRRSGPHVQVDEPTEVEVRGKGEEEGLIGLLADISIGGLCLRLPIGLGHALECGEQRFFGFRLPQSSSDLLLSGSVCGLRSESDAMMVSVEFDPEATGDYEAQRLSIEDFIARRQKNPPTVQGA